MEDTYRILITDKASLRRQQQYSDETRRDFGTFMRRAVSAYLLDDLARSMARLLDLSPHLVRDALGDTLKKWQGWRPKGVPCRTLSWDDVGVGTELYSKEYKWLRTISHVAMVNKGHGEKEAIYCIDNWGTCTSDELKEQFWLVEKD